MVLEMQGGPKKLASLKNLWEQAQSYLVNQNVVNVCFSD